MDPVAHVAPEAVTIEDMRVIAVYDNLRVLTMAVGKFVVGERGRGALDEVYEDFLVLRGEGKSGGEVAGRKERWSEMVGTGGEGERWMVPLW